MADRDLINQGYDLVNDNMAFGIGGQDLQGKPVGNVITGLASGLAQSAYSAVTLPGDVYAGKVDPTSEEGIQRSADLAGFMVGGSMPIAKAVGGVDGTLGSFAGVKSRTADRSLLKLAQDAEDLGFDPEQVRKSTGWMRGAEDRWKYEIDDSNSKFDFKSLEDGNRRNLYQVLDHPELYDAYPELKEVRVKLNPSQRGASYNNQTNIITLGSKFHDHGTLMHEVQHAIQEIEGFAKGGAPKEAGPSDAGKYYKLKYEDEIDKLRPEFLNLSAKLRKDPKGLSAEEVSRYNQLGNIFNKYSEYKFAGDNKAYENYRALAGEVEANNTSTRLHLNERQRQDISPLMTEDVGRSQQIVRMQPSYVDPYTQP